MKPSCKHPEEPDTRTGLHEEWLRKMESTHKQAKCPGCGLWKLWVKTKAVEVEIPIRIHSEMNERGHWSKRHRRAREHDEAVTYSLIGSRVLRDLVASGGPFVVTITRIAPRRLDSDNAVSGCKATRDSVARLLGIDDGSARIEWHYWQETGKTYACRIRIEIGQKLAKVRGANPKPRGVVVVSNRAR